MNGLDLDPKPADRPIVDASIIAAAQADAAVDRPVDRSPNDRSVEQLPARVIDYDAEAREVIAFAAALFFPLRPALEKIYTPEVQERIAAAGAPLLRKYNIDLSMLGPEITFAIVVIPLIAPTVAAIRAPADRSTKGANEKTQEKTPGPGVSAAGTTIGAEVTAENPLKRFPGLELAA